MRVTGDDEVDGVDVDAPEIRTDAWAWTCIDDSDMAAFAHDRRIALANVQEADFELLGD